MKKDHNSVFKRIVSDFKSGMSMQVLSKKYPDYKIEMIIRDYMNCNPRTAKKQKIERIKLQKIDIALQLAFDIRKALGDKNQSIAIWDLPKAVRKLVRENRKLNKILTPQCICYGYEFDGKKWKKIKTYTR